MLEIQTIVEEYVATKVQIGNASDIWLIFTGILVFFMHSGFAALEAGSVPATTVTNIMFKNIGTVSVGVLVYFLCGWAFAFGSLPNGSNAFISYSMFGNYKNDAKALWFFELVFAATGATILSGAVAGRIKISAYFVFTVIMVGVIYPAISHWVWATGGWLSAFTPTEDLFLADDNHAPCGSFDYAGSGVVHLTGGTAAFWGSLILGPRRGWTKAGIPPHNQALTTLGTFILWFGWYGFNCGSGLVFDGAIAGHVAVTTTLSPSAACVTGFLLSKLLTKKWDLTISLNCVLAGLVAITAGCATLTSGFAVLTGIISAFVYVGASKLIKKMNIDDPVDAIAVHAANGAWGVIAVALFLNDDLLFKHYSGKICDSGVGDQLLWQLLEVVSITAWVSVFAIPIFLILKRMGQLRVSEEEEANLDATEHGAAAYEKM